MPSNPDLREPLPTVKPPSRPADSRTGRLLAGLDAIKQDLRYGIRILRRNPGFLLVAGPVLALGVGLNAAVFSVVSGLFFRPIPVTDADQLVYVYRVQLSNRRTVVTNVDDIKVFQSAGGLFSGFSAHWGFLGTIAGDGETGDALGEIVLGNYFELLGVKPYRGRVLTRDDDRLDNPELALVIGYDFWMKRFKGDLGVVGKRVRLNDKLLTIVGVMEPGFRGLSEPWKPIQWWVTGAAFLGKDRIRMGAIGRLRPDVTLNQAQAVITALSTQMQEKQYTGNSFKPDPYIVRYASDVLTPFDPDAGRRPRLLALASAVVGGIVLLIAASNLAGILAVRMVQRTRELAVQRALGAGGYRIVRQLVAETVVVALIGSSAGLLVGWLAKRLFEIYSPFDPGLAISLKSQLIVFAGVICLGIGVGVALVAALQVRSIDVRSAVGDGAPGLTRRSRRRLRLGIVAPQVACATGLLVLGAMHGRTLFQVETADRGYVVNDVSVLQVSQWDPGAPAVREKVKSMLSGERAAKSRTFFEAVVRNIHFLPGATGVVTDRLPVYADARREQFTSQENYLADPARTAALSASHVSSGFFQVMGIDLIAGRDFDERDQLPTARTAIVSASVAAKWWPGKDAIGRMIAAYSPQVRRQAPDWLEVIGVVNDVRSVDVDDGARPWIYLPIGTWEVPWGYAVARATDGNVLAAMRNGVLAADPLAQVTATRTLDDIVAEILYPRRAAAAILAVTALLGLSLAALGLYGLVSYSVAQRLPEIGIRTALGAGRSRILLLVARDGAGAAVVGALPGLLAGIFAARATSGLVGPLPTYDVATICVVPIVVTIVVIIACYMPARRAVRVDPTILFRST